MNKGAYASRMRKLMLAFLSATRLASIDAATVRFAQFPNPSLYALIPNATLSKGHDPDPRFSLQAHYTNERLPATAVLMNTISLLAQAADLDFDGLVEYNKETTFPEYPTVTIDMQTAKAREQLPACFWVWALYGAAFHMIVHTKFFVSEFDILWKGKIVARLKYRKATGSTVDEDSGYANQGDNLSISSNTSTGDILRDKPYLVKKESSNGTQTAITIPTKTSFDSLTADSDLTITMQYLDNAKNLPIWTVFMMVFATLKDTAPYPATARTEPFETTVHGFDAGLYILRNEGPPITQPPFFERTHVTHAVMELPGLMLAEKIFAEVAFTIELDGKE